MTSHDPNIVHALKLLMSRKKAVGRELSQHVAKGHGLVDKIGSPESDEWGPRVMNVHGFLPRNQEDIDPDLLKMIELLSMGRGMGRKIRKKTRVLRRGTYAEDPMGHRGKGDFLREQEYKRQPAEYRDLPF